MLPKKLKLELSGHNVFTVQEKGWAGMKNGELLRRAENEIMDISSANTKCLSILTLSTFIQTLAKTTQGTMRIVGMVTIIDSTIR